MRPQALAVLVVACAACSSGPGSAPPANSAPTLEIAAPDRAITSFRGGAVEISYTASDDGPASTTLVADRDGDATTTADQVLIVADRTATGALQTEQWSTDGVLPGTYRILGRTTDEAGATADAVAVGSVTVADVPAPISVGGPLGDFESRVATIPDGSTILAGTTNGSFEVAGSTLGGLNTYSGFVVRYDRNGQPLWLHEIPGSAAPVFVRGVDAFADGSCVIVGAVGGSTTIGGTALSGPGILVARLDAEGTLQWARVEPNQYAASAARGLSVAACADGSCAVSGSFVGTLTIGTASVDAPSSYDLFIARYSADGDVLWARSAGGAYADYAAGLACAADGSCVLVGRTWAGAVFGAGEPGEATATNPDGHLAGEDGFVARYRPDGTLDWLRVFGGGSRDAANGVALDQDGACIVTGYIRFGARLGAGEPNEVTLEASGVQALVAKFSATGTLDWARTTATASYSSARAVVVQPDGGCTVAGSASGPGEVAFGAGEPTAAAFQVSGASDGFLARFDAAGNFVEARIIGGESVDDIYDLDRFEDGSVAVTGAYTDAVTIDAPLVALGASDLYLAWITLR